MEKNISDLREDLKKAKSTQIAQTPGIDPIQFERRLVSIKHPGWEQIIKSSEYKTWLETQDQEIQKLARTSTQAEDAINVLNQFVESQSSDKQTKVKSKRAERLAQAVSITNNHKEIRQKAESDMTDEELRRKIAAEVFAN